MLYNTTVGIIGLLDLQHVATSPDYSAQERIDMYVLMSYLHEAKFQQRETGSTVCWDGCNLVGNLRIIQHGFTDNELLKVMTSVLEGWWSSLLNDSWNETKFRFEQSH